MSRNDHIRAIVHFVIQAETRVTTSRAAQAIGMNLSCTREALAEAVELGFLTSTKEFQREAVFAYTGKSLEELEDPSTGLLAKFEELLSAWGIPLTAPAGWKGRVHQRFLKYQM